MKQAGEGSSALEQLAAAEKLLAAALRFHEYARERSYPNRKVPIRSGKGWDELRTPLASKLRTCESITSARPWPRTTTPAFASQHPPDERLPEGRRRREGGRRRAHRRGRTVAPVRQPPRPRPREGTARRVRGPFPGAGGDCARKLRRQLREWRQGVRAGREKKAVGDLTTARDELARAAALDPTIHGIREMQRELRTGYPILYVGVRQFPANMSPATARLDSEKQAVELIFEGLLEEVPEERARSATGPARRSRCRRHSRRARVRAPDIRARRESAGRGSTATTSSAPSKMLRVATTKPGPHTRCRGSIGPARPQATPAVRDRVRLGHPDPRALLTFKLLPARWLDGERQRGSTMPRSPRSRSAPGPFKLQGRTNPEPGVPREMVFVDNPGYGRWRDRTGCRTSARSGSSRSRSSTRSPRSATTGSTSSPTCRRRDLEKFTAPARARRQGAGGDGHRQPPRPHPRGELNAARTCRARRSAKGSRWRSTATRSCARCSGPGSPDLHKPMTGPFPPGSWAGAEGDARSRRS